MDKNLIETARPLNNMGIGKLGDESTIFVKQYRWLFRSNTLSASFIKKVKFNFTDQTIDFEAFEVVCDKQINIHDWLNSDLSKEILYFTTYDGCGIPLYTYELSKIVIISDKTCFDYSISDAVIRNLTVKYGKLKRIFHINSDEEPFERTKWIMNINGKEAKIKLANRPWATHEVNLQETEISHLKIPGKVSWNSLHIELESRHLLKELINNELNFISLKLLNNCNKVLETWELQNAWISAMSHDNETTKITLNYKNVVYEPAKNS